MGAVRRARRNTYRAPVDVTRPTHVVGAVAGMVVAVLLGWIAVGGAGGGLDSRLVDTASSAATRVGSALFLGCGLLLWAYSRQQRSDLAVRVGVVSVLLGAADALAAVGRNLDPHHPASPIGALTHCTVAVVCIALLTPAITTREPRPLRPRHLAATLGAVFGLFVVLSCAQLVRPGSLDGGPWAHGVLETVSAAAWASLACLVLTSSAPGLSATGRRHLSRVAVLLGTGHVLAAVDTTSVHLSDAFVVAIRMAAAVVLLRATWSALDERVSTAHRSQERLSAALVHAVDAAQDQERTRAQLTHDARNACASVRASLEILHDHGEELDSRTRARLREVAMFGVVHLEEVITRGDPYARDFDVMDVVVQVVDARRLLGTRVAVLAKEVLAHGRPHDVATALLNLLVNAERHAPGEPVTVDVTVREGRVRICVADSGPGVPSEHREHIFAGGWRGPRSSGDGLGLRCARELMRGQAGDLELVPSPQGAAFVLSLPAMVADRPADPPADPLAGPTTTGPPVGGAASHPSSFLGVR